MMFAHILRPFRRNQPVIAFCTCNSIGQIIVGRGDHHEEPPCLLLLSLAWKNKNIMTVISSNLSIRCFAAIQGHRGSVGPSYSRFPRPPGSTTRRCVFPACKGAPDTPSPPTISHPSRHFCPELLHRARGCFLARVLRLRFCRRKPRPLSIDPRWCVVCMGRNHCPTLLADIDGGMITAWSVIALSQQHPTFSRPIWYRMAPRLQGGPLPRTHPPTPLRNAMSSPGTCPTRSSILLILN
jgi:hypothetical protein